MTFEERQARILQIEREQKILEDRIDSATINERRSINDQLKALRKELQEIKAISKDVVSKLDVKGKKPTILKINPKKKSN